MTAYTLIATIIAAFTTGGIVAWLAARAETEKVRRELASRSAELVASQMALAAVQASLAAAGLQNQERIELMLAARKELGDQFRALAAEVLDEKGKSFVELNQATLAQILTPLQGELKGFREKVELVHTQDVAGRSALEQQVKMLTELNATVRDETANLTKALKGDAKTQGNWGEVILERLLDSAGLITGEHYVRQESHQDDDGRRAIPDVVLNLPNDRHLVVDSKVTLTAYSELVAAPDDAARAKALRAHLDSVRRHVKELSEKKYQTLYNLTSVDFTVMFMPLEGAFMTAVTNDQELFQFAWERNVILVSPSTLLFVVRTVAFLWGQEKQKRNHQEIAERGASLYEKFVGFTVDLAKVGEQLDKARSSFDDARAKLSTGRANLVRQAEQLKDLGVRPAKTLAPEWTAGVDDDEPDAGSRKPDAAPPGQLVAPSNTILPS